MRRRSLMIGKESTEESRKEMSRSPGAPSPPANATIFCFQPFRLSDNRNSRRQPLPLEGRNLFPPRVEGNRSSAIRTISLAESSFVPEQRQGHRSKSLRKRGAVEVVHEDLHQCSAVKIRKAWYFADHSDVSKPLYGFAILAVLVAN